MISYDSSSASNTAIPYKPNDKKRKDILLPDISKENSDILISLIENGRRIAAVQKYRILTNKCLKDCLIILNQSWKAHELQNIDPEQYILSYPKCCYTCIGACGEKSGLIENFSEKLWDTNKKKPQGADCGMYVNSKHFIEHADEKVSITRNELSATVEMDAPIIKMSSSPDNKVEFQVSSQHDFPNHINSFIEKMCMDGWKITRSGQNVVNLRIYNTEPKPYELWEDYINRALSSIRDKRIGIKTKYDCMTDEEVVIKLTEFLLNKGFEDALDSSDDLQSFIDDYFPDQEPRQLLISLEKEEIL